MFVFIPLLIVAALVSFYLWQKNHSEPTNRYRRKTRTVFESARTEPAVSIDADEALGLKPVVRNNPSANDVIVALYLMMPEGMTYAGYELLQALLSAGLRFGEHRIFHRHAHKDGRGDVLFHCASAVAPGTFDLTQIGSFTSQGLCLFFSTKDVAEPLATFDCLLETIEQLSEDLGGDVLDDKKQLLTKEKMIQIRSQLRDVEHSQVTADLFETIN